MLLLPQSIERQRENAATASLESSKNSCNVLGHLENLFTSAIKAAYPSVTNVVAQLQVSKHADYQCNDAMALAKVRSGTSAL